MPLSIGALAIDPRLVNEGYQQGRQAVEDIQADEQQRQQEAEVEQIRQTVQAAGGNYDVAEQELRRKGFLAAADGLAKAHAAQVKSVGDSMKTMADARNAELAFRVHSMNGVTDDSSYQALLNSSKPEDQQFYRQRIGDAFDPEKARVFTQSLMSEGERNTMQKNAFDQFWQTSDPKHAALFFKDVKSPEEWQHAQELARFRSGKAIEPFLNYLGDYSPEAVARAAQIAGEVKAPTEKAGQHIAGIYQGKRTFGVFDPNTNTFNVDGKAVSAQEFRPIPPEGAGGGSGGAANAKPTVIKPGTPAYKIAQDMAYGRLTFPAFRTLAAYNRDANLKFGIYALATEINPNFNQAAFEMGYKYAGNPKTINTLVSIDNALSNFDKAQELSQQVGRTSIPKLNEYLAKGRFFFGSRPVTNFEQFRTILGDDIALAIGQGAPTDYKTKLAQSLVDANLSDENFLSTLRQSGEFLLNRKRAILQAEGPYGEKAFNPMSNTPLPQVMGGPAGAPQVGQVVTLKGGRKMKITAVLPNGQLQGVPVQ